MVGYALFVGKKMNEKPLKIAVIGSGVAGLTAAYLLNKKHTVSLIEKDDRIGGHTRTLTLSEGPDSGLAIDTGFIVMNLRNYPNFTRLLKELEVEIQKSCMTFSYHDEQENYGYAGTSLRGILPDLSYLFKQRHIALVGDLIRFSFIGYKDLKNGYLKDKTLGDYLDERAFSPEFQYSYLLPMGAAIWSSPLIKMRDFPAEPYLHFLENHGLLRLINPPQWYTIKGGSHSYVKAIVKSLKQAPKLNKDIEKILRPKNAPCEIHYHSGEIEYYDHVVVATHADTALRLLGDADTSEETRLSPWKYQDNQVILHTDTEFMPPKKALWASWNFLRKESEDNKKQDAPVSISYYMNRLQKLKTKRPYIVTLNPQKAIDPNKTINSTILTHPLYSFDALNSQEVLREKNGLRNTWFCGSYFGYGFHEDAVLSSVQVANAFDIHL